MKPMYQGQIDVFCAAYAVVNAMRHLHSIRLLACRELFHEALLDLARDEKNFRDALNQHTDYINWVDNMLERQKRLGALRVEQPFPSPAVDSLSPPVSRDELWDTLARWFSGGTRRAVLLQFVRYMIPEDAQIRHWTCCCSLEGSTLHLYDSSLDPGSLHHLEQDGIITDEREGTSGRVRIVPHTVRLLRPRFEFQPKSRLHSPSDSVPDGYNL